MKIFKGQPTTLSFSFKKNGQFAIFTNPPSWILFNATGKRIQTGTATPNGTAWEANITIPLGYLLPDEGIEVFSFEATGIDNKNRSFSYSKEIEVIEEEQPFVPTGVVYNMLTAAQPLMDSIILPYQIIHSLTIAMKTPFEQDVVPAIVNTNVTASSITPQGYVYNFALGRPLIPYVFNDPFLLIIEAMKESTTTIPLIEIHPVYILNARSAILANSLEQYLNKARMQEVDPSFQFSTADYLHYLYEGIKIINAKDEMTFWTIIDLPLNLQQYLFAAAAWTALNARYLAEGQNSFEFTGMNTSLNYNRNEAFSTKMQEQQAYLDNGLALAKKSAISRVGRGTPPPNSTNQNYNRSNAGLTRFGGSSLTGRFGHVNRRVI